jgi:hypothetical protein
MAYGTDAPGSIGTNVCLATNCLLQEDVTYINLDVLPCLPRRRTEADTAVKIRQIIIGCIREAICNL